MKPILKLLTAAVLSAAVAVVGVVAANATEPGDEEPPEVIAIPGDQVARLEEVLERYREIERRGGWKAVPTDLVMGPGYDYECARIATLERRMIAEGYLRRGSTPPPAPPPLPGAAGKEKSRRAKPAENAPPPPPRYCPYTRALTEAVKAFQADRKVLGFGQVGKLTYKQLNRPVEEIIDIVERDLANWRHVTLEPSGTYLLVNIPFYELIAYEGGEPTLRMPVIVGQPAWQTPTFRAEVQYLIVNPDWGIPDKIAKAEYLPFVKRDPGYLKRQGITATDGSLRQKPGPNNPLGRIKFVMPNPNDVYLHDTPYKGAFNAAVKALSHGCVRLSRPVDLAAYLLRDHSTWDARRIEAAIASKKTQQIDLADNVPVRIVYSTSRVNEQGRLELRPDVYGKNKGPAPEKEARLDEEGIYKGP